MLNRVDVRIKIFAVLDIVNEISQKVSSLGENYISLVEVGNVDDESDYEKKEKDPKCC